MCGGGDRRVTQRQRVVIWEWDASLQCTSNNCLEALRASAVLALSRLALLCMEMV